MQENRIHYLEMTSRSDLRPVSDAKGLTVIECEIKRFEYNRFLHQLVGKDWHWRDRLPWTDEQWKAYSEAPNLRTWVAYLRGCPAGYFDLQKREPAQVEITCLGLAPGFIGRGLGGYLLTQALERAWAWGEVERVCLNTCSLDHPNALANYLARGMKLMRTELRKA